MLIIPQYKTAFITPQKVASTSIKRCLLESVGVMRANWKDWEKENTHDAYIGFTVAFVRNPFDRLVSCYHNQCIGEDRFGLGKAAWFKDFVKYVVEGGEIDKHFAPYELERADMVCRFETLTEDWARLRLRIPGLGKLGHENRTHARGHWSEYYDAWSLKVVREYYAKDFEKLGY